MLPRRAVSVRRRCGLGSARQRSASRCAAAVSKQVARLEARLGAQLFHRTTRSLALTEAGEQLYESSAAHWRSLQAALDEVTGPARAPAGCLRVSRRRAVCE